MSLAPLNTPRGHLQQREGMMTAKPKGINAHALGLHVLAMEQTLEDHGKYIPCSCKYTITSESAIASINTRALHNAATPLTGTYYPLD